MTIPGILHRSRERFADERGFFTEILRTIDVPTSLLQSNHSHSRAGTVRGLHYHRQQADLWYVVSGEILAVLVDLRATSENPSVETVRMSADTPATLFIPPGIAHGFSATTDCDLIYWVSREYDASDEFGIAWDDPQLAIDWGVEHPIISERDRMNSPLNWDDLPSFS